MEQGRKVLYFSCGLSWCSLTHNAEQVSPIFPVGVQLFLQAAQRFAFFAYFQHQLLFCEVRIFFQKLLSELWPFFVQFCVFHAVVAKNTVPANFFTFVVMNRLCRGFLLLGVALLLCAHASAQYDDEDNGKLFRGGLILGANFTQVDGDSYYGYHKIGVNAGAIVNAHFHKYVGASLELLYTQKGSRGQTKYESAGIGTYVEKYHMNLNYVEVPLLLHLSYKRFDAEVGASYALLVRSSEWVQSDRQVVIDNDRNYFDKTDLNYIFGLSRRMYKSLFLNVRFQYSIVPIRPTGRIPAGYIWGNDGQFNNAMSLRIIYYL